MGIDFDSHLVIKTHLLSLYSGCPLSHRQVGFATLFCGHKSVLGIGLIVCRLLKKHVDFIKILFSCKFYYSEVLLNVCLHGTI